MRGSLPTGNTYVEIKAIMLGRLLARILKMVALPTITNADAPIQPIGM